MMTRFLAAAALGLASFGITACTDADGTTDRQRTGALVGAATGAAAGQLIGGDTEATVVGAGLGAVAGGIAGDVMERREVQQQGQRTCTVYRGGVAVGTAPC